MINLGAIAAAQTAARVAAMNAAKKNSEKDKKPVDKKDDSCYNKTMKGGHEND